MNRDEAIAMLRAGDEGVREWNKWRDSAPVSLPDLLEADLSDTSLNNANLTRINLRQAKLMRSWMCGALLVSAHLEQADLSEARLNYSHLSWARLDKADLREADLTWAELNSTHLPFAQLQRARIVCTDFRYADLSGANMSESTVSNSHFTEAKLDGTDFTKAISRGNLWANVDLSEAKGLESMSHQGPSTLGLDTLYKSGGNICLPFLHGCGVPRTFIDYLPSLIASTQPMQFYSCFISHSSNDKEFCRRLHGSMQQEKLRVWFDEHDMQGGKKLRDQIDGAIQSYDKLLLVLSPDSMNSEWVKSEIHKARKKEQLENRPVLFPIALCDHATIKKWEFFDADTGKDIAREIREFYIPGDFQNWKDNDAFESAFAKLLRDLRGNTNTPTTKPPT